MVKVENIPPYLKANAKWCNWSVMKEKVFMTSKIKQTNEEIDKLYTDTYRARMPLYNDYVFNRVYGSGSKQL